MDVNFKCPKTGKEFWITEYTMRFTNQDKVYVDKYGSPLTNPENGELLIDIPRDRGLATAVHGSRVEQYQKMQAHLKQRSEDHYQKEVKYKKRSQGDLLGDTSKIK